MSSTDASEPIDSDSSVPLTGSSTSQLTEVTKTTSFASNLDTRLDTEKDEELPASAGQKAGSIAASAPAEDPAGDTAPEEEHPIPDGASSTSDDSDDDGRKVRRLKLDLSEDILMSRRVKEISSAKGKANLRSKQTISYFLLVEARIKDLERELAALKDRNALSDSKATPEGVDPEKEEADASASAQADVTSVSGEEREKKTGDDDERWHLKASWKPFFDYAPPRYSSDKKLPEPLIDILYEPVPSVVSRFARRKPKHGLTKPADHPKREIHQVRINSPYICDAFTLAARKTALEKHGDEDNLLPVAGEAHIRPFKAFLEYDDQLRQVLVDLKESLKDNVPPPQTPAAREVAQAAVELKLNNDKSPDEPQDDALDDPQDDPLEDPKKRRTIALHLEAYLEFVDEHLQADLGIYRQLRAREIGDGVPKVSFLDLWKLFAPGDEVYSSNGRQVYAILAVSGGRRPLHSCVEKERDRVDTERAEKFASDFTITCFNLNFNGSEIGPVQHDFAIPQFEGARSITRLPIFPLEYADFFEGLHKSGKEFSESRTKAPSMSTRQQLIERGQRFAELATRTIYHRDYEGYSLGVAKDEYTQEMHEQIDSEIIIDFEKFFQLFPRSKPSLALNDIPDGPESETKQVLIRKCGCSISDCTLNSDVELLYDDRKVDEARKKRLMDRISDIVRWRSVSEGVLRAKDDYCLLFPRNIFAFVLKNRTWYELNVAGVQEIPTNRNDFDQLVLPEDHKLIVRSLVETHKIGPKAATIAMKLGPQLPVQADSVVREDLVRGKGKGLIVLLHGVPGVGKTSTAECVAEYTSRPLFALTCGDLGESPGEVQEKLQECFTLAYRWSCVMLLDEADVFLQRRDRTDLKRNAVVSVFLRTLEYYSGILFLTTNRVGVFDEAFKSRIHVSLYYEPLTKDQAEKIWEVNLDRIGLLTPDLVFKKKRLMKWARNSWSEEDAKQGKQWNGRQIHNAVRTAAALAAFSDENELTTKHMEIVAKTSRDFDQYLKDTTGNDDWARAQMDGERLDPRTVQALQTIMMAGRNSEWTSPFQQQSQPQPPQNMNWTNGPVNNAQQPMYGHQEQWQQSQQTPFQAVGKQKMKKASRTFAPPPAQPAATAQEDDSSDDDE